MNAVPMGSERRARVGHSLRRLPTGHVSRTQVTAGLFVLTALILRTGRMGLEWTSDFNKSYWLLNYDYGFIRRGLAGEALQAFFPLSTASGLIWMPAITSIVGVVTIVCVCLHLISTGKSQAIAGAMILAASPATLGFVWEQRRPDLLAITLIPLVWATAGKRSLWVASGIFSALILVHEGIVFSIAPWLLVVLALRTGLSADILRLFAFPGLVAVSTYLIGRGNESQAGALEAAAAPYIDLSQSTMFNYLGDTLTDSFGVVRGLGIPNMLAMLLVGAAFVLVHLVATLWLKLLPPLSTWVWAALALTVIAGGLEMLLGYDWLRWISMWVCCWLIVVALNSPLTSPVDGVNQAGLARWTIPIFLLAIPTMPEFARLPQIYYVLVPHLPTFFWMN